MFPVVRKVREFQSKAIGLLPEDCTPLLLCLPRVDATRVRDTMLAKTFTPVLLDDACMFWVVICVSVTMGACLLPYGARYAAPCEVKRQIDPPKPRQESLHLYPYLLST